MPLQKLSKNAIFSLHRGDLDGAAQQISSAEEHARELLPTIAANPALRCVCTRCLIVSRSPLAYLVSSQS